jgi:hypothetical protein
VFLINSRHPHFCAPSQYLRISRALLSRSYEGNLPSSLTMLLSTPRYTLPFHLCRFRVRLIRRGSFLGPPHRNLNPIRDYDDFDPSPPTSSGILTRLPSATPFGLTLGTGSTCPDWHGTGTLGISADGVLARLIATQVSIITCDISSMPCQHTFTDLRNAPLPLAVNCKSTPSVHNLAPIHFRRSIARPVSCYAFFK